MIHHMCFLQRHCTSTHHLTSPTPSTSNPLPLHTHLFTPLPTPPHSSPLLPSSLLTPLSRLCRAPAREGLAELIRLVGARELLAVVDDLRSGRPRDGPGDDRGRPAGPRARLGGSGGSGAAAVAVMLGGVT